jgi:hypothetical protein
LYRNLFSQVPWTKVREVAAMLKAIHANEDVAVAREKALQVIAKPPALRLTIAAARKGSAIPITWVRT